MTYGDGSACLARYVLNSSKDVQIPSFGQNQAVRRIQPEGSGVLGCSSASSYVVRRSYKHIKQTLKHYTK